MTRIRVSVVIPFLNESENLSFLLPRLDAYFGSWRGAEPEVIFVDDGSSDDSVAVIKAYRPQAYHASLVRLSKNFGSHSALRAGISVSTGRWIMNLSADGQDPLELILTMLAKAEEGSDIVFAVRRSMRRSWMEVFFSRMYARLLRWTAFPNFPANGTDIVMMSEKVRDRVNENTEADNSLFLQIMAFGFRQSFVEYYRGDRRSGKSKWTLSKKVKLLTDSFIGFSFAPLRFSFACGAILLFLGGSWGLFRLHYALSAHDLTPGWSSLVSVLLIGFGVTNLSLGILGEYLCRTLSVSRNR